MISSGGQYPILDFYGRSVLEWNGFSCQMVAGFRSPLPHIRWHREVSMISTCFIYGNTAFENSNSRSQIFRSFQSEVLWRGGTEISTPDIKAPITKRAPPAKKNHKSDVALTQLSGLLLFPWGEIDCRILFAAS